MGWVPLGKTRDSWERRGGVLTVEFLENALYGAGTAAAGHCDGEFVGVGHFGSAGWS